MTRRFTHFGLPLLGKELVEQAARRRTYSLRVAYAVLLFLVAGVLFYQVLRPAYYGGAGWQYVLGSGARLFEGLVFIQFAGILLFLPALMAGAIAEEKEKASLALLFLTDIGPGELLLQKYLGRLIPMFTFLLLALPLMGVAYAFGGITIDRLLAGGLLLFLACLQVGAFSLMCSAYCQTTVGAFVLSYVGLGLFYAFPVLVFLFVRLLEISPYRARMQEELLFAHVPLFVFERYGTGSFNSVLLHCQATLASVAVFWFAARAFLVRRAFHVAHNPFLSLFRRLDVVFKGWNDSLGGVEMMKGGESLPEEDPVAWRELHKRALGRWHYLVRFGLVIEVPVLFLGLAAMFSSRPGGPLAFLIFTAWILAALMLAVQGANALVAERSQQTLEVLLVTPLSGRDIVRQKMRAILRFAGILAVPLLTLTVMRSWLGSTGLGGWGYYSSQRVTAWEVLTYLYGALAAIAIYLPMIAWGSVAIGLHARTRFRAIICAVAALVAWCVLPVLACFILGSVSNLRPDDFPVKVFLLLSPASAVVLTELGHEGWREVFRELASFAVLANFMIYGTALMLLRNWCLDNADRCLRRE